MMAGGFIGNHMGRFLTEQKEASKSDLRAYHEISKSDNFQKHL